MCIRADAQDGFWAQTLSLTALCLDRGIWPGTVHITPLGLGSFPGKRVVCSSFSALAWLTLGAGRPAVLGPVGPLAASLLFTNWMQDLPTSPSLLHNPGGQKCLQAKRPWPSRRPPLPLTPAGFVPVVPPGLSQKRRCLLLAQLPPGNTLPEVGWVLFIATVKDQEYSLVGTLQ